MPQHIHTTLARAAAVLALLFGLAGCGPTPAPNEITIASSGMIFSVTEARGKVGQEVVLRLVNRDSYAHAFDIDEFNVHLTLEGKATLNDETLFAFELSYAGVFRIFGVPQEQLHAVVMIDCPRLLFPFARAIVAEAVRNGGFPPLYIDPRDLAEPLPW